MSIIKRQPFKISKFNDVPCENWRFLTSVVQIAILNGGRSKDHKKWGFVFQYTIRIYVLKTLTNIKKPNFEGYL